MKRWKSVTGVALALMLVLTSALVNPPGASAAPTLKIVSPGERGSDYIVPTVIQVDNCDDPAMYSGLTYKLMDASGAVVTQGAMGNDGRVIQLSPEAGVYTIEVTCLIYNTVDLPPVLTSSATFVVASEVMLVRAGDPKKGGQVTVYSIGRLTPGERVSLTLIDASAEVNGTGKAVVLKTWATTPVVGANGEWTDTVTLPSSINPKRAYKLSATGLTSKTVVNLYFGDWLNPDKNGLPGTGD